MFTLRVQFVTRIHNRHISVNELLQGACQRPVTVPAHLPIARFWAVRCAPAHFRKSEFSGEVVVTIAMGDRRRSTDSAVPPSGASSESDPGILADAARLSARSDAQRRCCRAFKVR